MREICTSGSVRGWGERSPQPTRTMDPLVSTIELTVVLGRVEEVDCEVF